ncbi:Tetrapyrrole-binding family protein [Tripterygium wilfordii]|uniref:Tetrapyrrole-binding family protein n=1 Tax=Tripterygium wilfordii TaxID=458696 RepID=A0A7J7C8E1_TRIWF|nr:tetrapyrrole-binding protein, chloroplastic-like [Tripterygium wilfordii]XP_038686795.1 tetrapyrrole-binding protein, chloroplastic-like [Tripterygium wilfordii]KAF5730414.1 Tetrapyrrole-binding family protein [Tripterygium wilfordii]KAF5732464.1 Tetrapyrrole-binding family protein [Tripterygium wilfordii]
MATNSLQSLHHHHHHYSLLKRHSFDTIPSSLFLKPSYSTVTNSLSQSISSSTTTFSFSSTSTSTSQSIISFEQLQHHLSTHNFFQADEETRRLLIVLAGEAAQKRGYVFFSEVQFISESDLKTIDSLWRQYSNNRFGYSVQRKIWSKVNEDFTKFFLKVGWMKKLDTEVEQYNYRSFPTEFTWELKDDTPPEGHLPLTNALRGTQLLNSILSHPAFEKAMEGEVEEEKEEVNDQDKAKQKQLLINTVFKTDYSF